MMAWRNPDGRVRGAFRYHGTSTGRWTSLGVQLQNMKRPLVEDMGAAIDAVKTGDLARMQMIYPQPLAIVGDVARAAHCARPGCQMIIADFSGIEARVLAWLAGEQSEIDQWEKFDRTGDLKDEPYYITGAATGLTRDKGKTCTLAFGFMGGVIASSHWMTRHRMRISNAIKGVAQCASNDQQILG